MHGLLWLSCWLVFASWAFTICNVHASFRSDEPVLAVLCLLVTSSVKRERMARRLARDVPVAPTLDWVSGSADIDPESAAD